MSGLPGALHAWEPCFLGVLTGIVSPSPLQLIDTRVASSYLILFLSSSSR